MNLAFWLSVLLAGYSPGGQEPVLRDSVDLVEVNHYHDPRGQPVFDQLIFYDWSSQHRRFQVRAWRLIKSDSQLPKRDHRGGHWVVRWHDDGNLREVTAVSHRETWTRYDPELIEREFLPQEQRLDLSSQAEHSARWQSVSYRPSDPDRRAMPVAGSDRAASANAR